MFCNTLKKSVVCLSSLSALVACSAIPVIGFAPSDTPPRMIIDSNDKKTERWDRPFAFGPVPASEEARGGKICSSLDKGDVKFKAIGYHPKAQNLSGKTFEGGGFFCAQK